MFKLYFSDSGAAISLAGDFSNPIAFSLRIDLSQIDETRIYAEADPGFVIRNVVVRPVPADEQAGGTIDKWSLAPDVNGQPGQYGNWGEPLSLGDVGEGPDGRKYFWVRARVTSDEQVMNDGSVLLEATGIAEAV